MADFDAIIVGGGHNGLVSALYLANAGWRVAVVERSSTLGGTVQSGEVTLPGFTHDLYATNLVQFVTSPIYREFREAFNKTGLRFLTNGYPFASVYEDGQSASVFTDPDATEREIARHSNADLDGWRKALGLFKRTARSFLPLFFTEIPSAEMVRRLGELAVHPIDAARLLRILCQSTRQFVDQYFNKPEIKGLVAPWGLHVDCAPDVAAGAPLTYVPTFAAHLRGAFVTEGGASRLIDAFRTLLELRGAKFFVDSDVTRIVVSGNRAVGIETKGGDALTASRAVIASVTPRNLFLKLLSPEQLPSGFIRRVDRYRYGPSTFVVHLALKDGLAWRAGEHLGSFAYVHLYSRVDDLQATYEQAMSGLLPTHPMLVISQMSPIDPSRAPKGFHVARIHARALPFHIRGDAAGRISAATWDEAKESYADRLVDLLALHTPNVKEALLARHVTAPSDLERGNTNLIAGDCVSGSHHFDQNYMFRPFYGWSRYATPIPQLYMVGAATWPAGGVNGGSGYLLAKQLLRAS